MNILLRKPPVLLLLLLFFVAGSASFAQVNVTPNQTWVALAQKLAGPGISVLNATGSCSAQGNGFFTVTSSNLGLDSGIILTTGRAQTSGGSIGVNGNATSLADVQLGLAGDAQLNTVFNLNNSFDACRLEFDLIPKGDSIKFDYVFGSEEYLNSVCAQYNDAFAFFISGPGITGSQNIALVPGTNVPVAVNSVNNGIPGIYSTGIATCNAMGAGSPFTSYYVDNAAGTTVTYRGFTKVLTAVKAVQPCSTYHLKLVIADAVNGRYDSGVFIKGGSLKTSTFNASVAGLAGVGTSTPYIVKGCTPGTISIKRSQKKSVNQAIKYIIAGDAVNGVDYLAITDSVIIPANDTIGLIHITGLPTTSKGQKILKLYFISPYSCNGLELIDSASLLIEDALQVAIETKDTAICEAQEFALKVDGSNNYVYSWSPATGLSNANIKEPLVQTQYDQAYVLTAALAGSGCPPAKDTFKVKVTPKPIVEAGADQQLCEGGSFTLTATVTPSNHPYWRTWVAPSGNGPSGYNADQITVNNAGTSVSGYYVITASSDVCADVSDSLLVTVKPNPPKPYFVSPVSLCLNLPVERLIPPFDDYRWYTSETGGTGDTSQPGIINYTTGIYTFYVSTVRNGCEGARSELVVNMERCCVDNFFMADAFTPNGDGINDRLHIIKGMEDKLVQFQIFNRWGQLMYEGIDEKGWDGSYHGTPLETGTYYYQVTIGCDRGNNLIRKGSVTLIR